MLLSPESTDVTTTDDGLSLIMVKTQSTHRPDPVENEQSSIESFEIKEPA
jgi:hypothetical protein